MMIAKHWVLYGAAALGMSCGGGGAAPSGTAVDPLLGDVTAASFVGAVDNPYFPLPVGARWTYEAEDEDGKQQVVVEVLAKMRTIQGVAATVVRDTASHAGQILEDTEDWYAQDSDGNVWYLGEATCAYQNGECKDRAGSWEWGVDGALPGIMMPAAPRAGAKPYFQEYYARNAEDVGEVVALPASITLGARHFDDCVRTHDTSAIDPEESELKTYCRGVGLVQVEEARGSETFLSSSGL